MGQTYQEKVYEIVDQLDAPHTHEELITLANGIVLKPRPVPPLVLARVEKKFKYPPVPQLMDEDKGRIIENPDDPNYLNAIAEVDAEKSMAQLDVIIGLGTEIVSVPLGMFQVGDDGWLEEVEFFIGEPVPKSGRARYLAYLKYYAMSSANDIPNVARLALRKTGIGDVEVENALAGFRSEEVRRADPSTGIEA